MVLNSGVGDNKPSTAGSEKKVAFSDVDGDEEMAKIPEEDEDLHTEAWPVINETIPCHNSKCDASHLFSLGPCDIITCTAYSELFTPILFLPPHSHCQLVNLRLDETIFLLYLAYHNCDLMNLKWGETVCIASVEGWK